ncbi:MAG TPA: alanine--tRNA ligase, partial [Bacteroidales bacterium]|nr:alanine--tRNA ligase [Bacteroidales bacterium]
RMIDGTLQLLPMKHVDTGMGFERLCMILQGKSSNYDTDIFQMLIKKISELSGQKYGSNEKTDIAMRVVADHVRAVAFAIADGQLPSNNKAGYVIRRILRRAVRYGYTFLNFKEPFVFELIPVLAETMGDNFPEIIVQQEIIKKIIIEEEQIFLKTLSSGINRFMNYVDNYCKDNFIIDGKFAFELFDTYGFPIDLTQLMAKEAGLSVDMEGFQKYMEEQKQRSRIDAKIDSSDWVEVLKNDTDSDFVGYDLLEAEVKIVKYRRVIIKSKEMYQVVFDKTPFYAEAGGQIGDSGYIEYENIKIPVVNTKKENNVTVHYLEKLPADLNVTFIAKVDKDKRLKVTNNHTATHLLHFALREVLGKHIEQKGSLVEAERLRFDFSHYQKITYKELYEVERLVNSLIRDNIGLFEKRNIHIEEAKSMGALALFGEKYGDKVRVVKFGGSVELCGGCHVKMTGQIGLFKIISETAIAAGIRRIEAVTGEFAEEYVNDKLTLLREINNLLKNPKDPLKVITQMSLEINELNKKIEELNKEKYLKIIPDFYDKMIDIKGTKFLATKFDGTPEEIKNLSFDFRNRYNNFILIIGSNYDNKASLSVMLSDDVVAKGLDAVFIVKTLAKEIQGGGGGQKFYAVAGGKYFAGLDKAILSAKDLILQMLNNLLSV